MIFNAIIEPHGAQLKFSTFRSVFVFFNVQHYQYLLALVLDCCHRATYLIQKTFSNFTPQNSTKKSKSAQLIPELFSKKKMLWFVFLSIFNWWATISQIWLFFLQYTRFQISNETDAHLNAHAKTDLLERNPKLHAQSHRKKHSDTHENMDSRIKCASNTNSRMLHAHSHQHQYKGSRIWEATGDTSAHQAVLFLWKCECDVLVYAFVCVRYMFVATPK